VANQWLTGQHTICLPESINRLQEFNVSANSPDNQKPERPSTDVLQQLVHLLTRQAAQGWTSAHNPLK
jgi:hypothetical protein